jgi:nucleotide-binding universal stress UspA family protein
VLEPDKLASYPLAADAGLYHNIDGARALLYKHLEELVPDEPAGPPVERFVTEGQPAEVILQQAQARRADLVVMSAHAYGAVQKLFTVSTVDAVLEQTPCPLLAMPLAP